MNSMNLNDFDHFEPHLWDFEVYRRVALRNHVALENVEF